MKICIVSREVYPYIRAGIGVYIYNLSRLLRDKGHEVFLVTDNYEGISENIDFNGITVVPVINQHPIYPEIFTNFNLLYSFNVLQTLKKLTETNTFDVIEFSDYFGESFFTLKEKKENGFLKTTAVVVKCHTPMFEASLASNQPIEKYLPMITQEDYGISHANSLSAISHSLAEALTKRLKLTTPIEILLNPLGIKETQESIYQDGEEKIILYVGKLQHIKGVDLLINAAVQNLQKGLSFKVIMIGQDVEHRKDGLVDLIPSKFKPCFEFIDFLDREKVFEYFNKAYISVFPSRWEGLSNVSIEAVTHGCPLILSDAGGLKEMKNFGDFGKYVTAENQQSLTDEMYYLITNPDKRNKYARNCFEQSHIFLDDCIYEKQIAFYQKAIKNHVIYMRELTMNSIYRENFMHSITLNTELHNEINRLNKELLQSSEQFKSLDETYRHLNIEFSNISEQCNNLSENLNRLQKDINEEKNENIRLTEEIENLKRQLPSSNESSQTI